MEGVEERILGGINSTKTFRRMSFGNALLLKFLKIIHIYKKEHKWCYPITREQCSN